VFHGEYDGDKEGLIPDFSCPNHHHGVHKRLNQGLGLRLGLGLGLGLGSGLVLWVQLQDSEFRIQGSNFRVQAQGSGLRLRVSVRFGVKDSVRSKWVRGVRVRGLGLG
jgi:hypothetical protein